MDDGDGQMYSYLQGTWKSASAAHTRRKTRAARSDMWLHREWSPARRRAPLIQQSGAGAFYRTVAQQWTDSPPCDGLHC